LRYSLCKDCEYKPGRWYIPVIPALGRQRQDDHKFEDSLGYIERLCLKKQKRDRL
jgi:hypothetical protein